jgi:hypothetical protein
MDVSEEAWKYKRDWKDLRRKPLGEILQMKFHGRSPYYKELAEMELKRRTFVRDVIFDRTLSASAIVISIVALVFTYLSQHNHNPKFQQPPASASSQP